MSAPDDGAPRPSSRSPAGTGLWLAASPLRVAAAGPEAAPAAGFQPNAWLNVDSEGAVTVWLGQARRWGRARYTGMAVLVAEELEADWKDGAGGPGRRRPEVRPDDHRRLVQRPPVLGAAAQGRRRRARDARRRGRRRAGGWTRRSCRAEKGAVVHAATGRRVGYGELAAAAAKLPVPEKPRLKDPKDFTLIGKAVPRLDTPPKTRGAAVFGIDVRVPGMLHAAVARPPALGGKVARFDAAKALAVPGVRKVVEVPIGVAVLADTTWAALQGREALSAHASTAGPNGALDSAAIARLLDAAPLRAARRRAARATSRRRSPGRRGSSRPPTTCPSSPTPPWSP